jgi:hypothetical protein
MWMVMAGALALGGSPLLAEPVGEVAPSPLEQLENRFFEALGGGQATAAESLLLEGLRNGLLTGKDPVEATLMVSLGNEMCELGLIASAAFWLKQVQTRFGNEPAGENSDQTWAQLLAPKIAWLEQGGHRTWVEPTAENLARKIFRALQPYDRTALDALLVPFDVYIGWWQSELEPVKRDELLSFLESHRAGLLTWVNEKHLPALPGGGEAVVYLKTKGWSTPDGYTTLQFALHQLAAGGWEWRGVVLGEEGELPMDGGPRPGSEGRSLTSP